MKSIALILLFVIPASYADECRYTVSKKGSKYYLMKVVEGELPTKKDKVKTDLELGISDINYKTEKGDTKEVRVKVRDYFDSKEKAYQSLSDICD